MHYLEAPEFHEPTLFLAGGITGCPDWQAAVCAGLKDCPLTVFNPRRKQWDMQDRAAPRKQIEWEHQHLRRADAILFWFPRESVCPIALYELGAWSMTSKPLFIGIEGGYPRRVDVEIQTELARQDALIRYSLDKLVEAVRHWVFWVVRKPEAN